MQRYNKQKRSYCFILILLLMLSIGLGYAVLSERLTIYNNVSYDSMKWDVGFTSAVDNGGSVTSIPSISSDKKSISILCDIGISTSLETCITKATITNNSTFNIMLEDIPTITYDDTYISSVYVSWVKSFDSPKQFDGIKAGNSEDIQIKVITRELTEDLLPDESITISISIAFDWIEADGNENDIVSIVGQEIAIGEEMFNIISATETTVTMLAKYNVGIDYKQNSTLRDVMFASSNGWEYTPGPKEIDIQQFDGQVKTHLNEYVSYLKSVTGDANLTGTLITLRELKALGCTITEDYSHASDLTCENSEYKSWLVNKQYWWTRSAFSGNPNIVWMVTYFGELQAWSYKDPMGGNGVRPIITISKDTLKQYYSNN